MRGGIDMDEISYSRVQLMLKRLAKRVPDHAARTLRAAANRIVRRAKELAPEDTVALVESIRLEVIPGRRLTFQVVMGGPQMTEWGVPLDHYAALVHENYEDIVTSGKYVGEGTRRKQAQGIAVGGQFLTRAAEHEKPALIRGAAEAVKSVIKQEVY